LKFSFLYLTWNLSPQKSRLFPFYPSLHTSRALSAPLLPPGKACFHCQILTFIFYLRHLSADLGYLSPPGWLINPGFISNRCFLFLLQVSHHTTHTTHFLALPKTFTSILFPLPKTAPLLFVVQAFCVVGMATVTGTGSSPGVARGLSGFG